LLLLFAVPETVRNIHYLFNHHATSKMAYETIDDPEEALCPFQHVFYYPYAVFFNFSFCDFFPNLIEKVINGKESAVRAGKLLYYSIRAPPV
jgi:hypothetical protein